MLGQRSADLPRYAGEAELRCVGHKANDAAERTGAVKRALRPFEHFDPFEIGQAEVGIGGVVAQAKVAEILPDRGLRRPGEAGIGDAADEQLVAAATEMGRRDGGESLGDFLGAADAAEFELFAIEQRNLARELVEREVPFARDDDDWRPLGLGDYRVRQRGVTCRLRARLGRGAPARLGLGQQAPAVTPGRNRASARQASELANGVLRLHPPTDRAHATFGHVGIGDDNAGAGLPRDGDCRIGRAPGGYVDAHALGRGWRRGDRGAHREQGWHSVAHG